MKPRPKPKPGPKPKTHVCGECSKEFSSRSNLTRHIDTSHPNIPNVQKISLSPEPPVIIMEFNKLQKTIESENNKIKKSLNDLMENTDKNNTTIKNNCDELAELKSQISSFNNSISAFQSQIDEIKNILNNNNNKKNTLKLLKLGQLNK